MAFPQHATHFAAALAVVCAISIGVAAQQQEPTFRSGTEIVSLFVTVADSTGRLVPDLTIDDFEILDNDKPQADRQFRERRSADQRRRHARHQRQHDRLDRAVETGRRTVLHPAAAGRQGARRRVQRQDRDQRPLHERSGSADHRHQAARFRKRHASLGRCADGSRGAERHRRPPRGAGLYRRRRHRQPRAPGHRGRPRPRRRSDGLRDRPREQLLQRPAHGADRARQRPAQDRRRNRRRLLRAQEVRRPRADVHSRRAGAARAIRDGLFADGSWMERSTSWRCA